VSDGSSIVAGARSRRRETRQARGAIEGFLAQLGTAPRGLHGVLEVAVAGTTRIDDPGARATLERIAGELSASSKLGKLARALLES
jgi:hypothetical protein